jgi:hypothetical protein
VIDVEGNRVDIGHTLLTIDALTHTTTGAARYTTYGVPSIDLARWVAAVGIWAERDGPNAPNVLPKLTLGRRARLLEDIDAGHGPLRRH